MVSGAPIPLYFDYEEFEPSLNHTTKKPNPVIYYGFRPKDSLEAHREFSRPEEGKYHFKFPPHSNVIDIALLGKKIRPTEPLPFTGMNPDITDPEELVFDGRFESGNLDMAVKTKDNEYDLYMRVDANTRGHH